MAILRSGEGCAFNCGAQTCRVIRLSREDWIDYLCRERLKLPEPILAGILADLHDGLAVWTELIRRSYLSPARQDRYLEILQDRHHRLFS